jgi:hypothetical protein
VSIAVCQPVYLFLMLIPFNVGIPLVFFEQSEPLDSASKLGLLKKTVTKPVPPPSTTVAKILALPVLDWESVKPLLPSLENNQADYTADLNWKDDTDNGVNATTDAANADTNAGPGSAAEPGTEGPDSTKPPAKSAARLAAELGDPAANTTGLPTSCKFSRCLATARQCGVRRGWKLDDGRF